jgi:ribulose-5-phosphate 4-epimerase/fuculose-1-phosphate aldolase
MDGPAMPGGPAVGRAAPLPVEAVAAIRAAGRRLDALGWVPATAGNISLRLDDGRIAITRSGFHKGFVPEDGVMAVDLDGRPGDQTLRPSAETGCIAASTADSPRPAPSCMAIRCLPPCCPAVPAMPSSWTATSC